MNSTKIARRLFIMLVMIAAASQSLIGCAHHHHEPVAVMTHTVTKRTTTSVSTSGTPASDNLQQLVDEAYAQFKNDKSGKNADYIPYLASVPSDLFGVAIVTADGRVYTAGDVTYSFSIQSCSKVFTLAQIIQESGEEDVMKKI